MYYFIRKFIWLNAAPSIVGTDGESKCLSFVCEYQVVVNLQVATQILNKWCDN